MILPMAKVRVLGPRQLLDEVLPILQDFGQLHLTPPKESGDVSLVRPRPDEERRERQLTRILKAVRDAQEAIGQPSVPGGKGRSKPERAVLLGWARLARRVRADADKLREHLVALEEERALLARYRQFFASFRSMAEAAWRWPEVAAYYVVLPESAERSLGLLEEGLREILGDEFDVWSEKLESGERGALILVPHGSAERLEELIRSARLQEIELPGTEEGLAPAEAIRRVLERLDAIPSEARGHTEALTRLRERHGEALASAEATLVDALARMDAVERIGATDHAFVLEGWLPAAQRMKLQGALDEVVGKATVVEEIDREEWVGEDVPVVLENPRIFRPFERVVSFLPLPRYGSMDPTPFLAVFFPMFFGIVLGDVGYGVILGGLAFVLGRGSGSGSTRRAVAQIAAACAAFTVVFGVLYGELFGDAGSRLLGMRALAFQREEALLPFLGLALAIGVVHIVLGLVLNVAVKLREGAREAVGPGVKLIMVVAVVFAILAATDVLPHGFFTPAVVVTLVLFPLLVVVEGILGPTELLSTLGHILSYARVMAVGTASVMMAVAANRMIGAAGSVVVGSLFALLFHLVNFILGVFSPTVHALRLHFVEFFGTFYSPGGVRYEPFGHWAAEPPPKPRKER